MERLVGITTYWQEEGQETEGQDGAGAQPRLRSEVNPSLGVSLGEGQGRPRLQAQLRLDSEVSLGIGFRERTKATIQGK